MNPAATEPVVVEIAGEMMRFRVSSRTSPDASHVVDLSEWGGNGACSCKGFRTTCTHNWNVNGRVWVGFLSEEGGVNPLRTQCWHIWQAREHVLNHMLRDVACRLHPFNTAY